MQFRVPQPILFRDSTAVVQLTVNQLVVGSIPTLGASFAGVAQTVEQLTCNEKVEGSIPFSGTSFTRV